MRCELCLELTRNQVYANKYRAFYHCLNCDLIFVPSEYHLNAEEEKKQYDFHQNSPNDLGYRQFLTGVVTPLLDHIKPGMKGLDFGSGPGPTLHFLFNEAGFEMALFDPFYANNSEHLKQQYDFVTCTEVVEHFSTPCLSWQQLSRLVRGEGYLAIMTLFHHGIEFFSDWWYKNDLTHVAFYSSRTMQWIARQLNLQLVYNDEKRVMIFKKSSSPKQLTN